MKKRFPAIRQHLPSARKCNLLALFLLVFVTGCGGSGPDRAVRDYFTAVVDGDGERACQTLTPKLRRDIDRSPAARRSGATCTEVMELAAGLNPDLTKKDIEDLSMEITEDGDRATARLRNPLVGRREAIGLQDGDGDWKISSLETRPRG